MDQQNPAQNRDRPGSGSGGLLDTFVCHGTWLPGQTGALDRNQNRFGSRLPEPDLSKERMAANRMSQPAYQLDQERRAIVLETIRQVCSRSATGSC
jgi:hypothetical protein